MALLAVPLAPAASAATEGSRGNPSNECAGLVYLDKFDFTTETFDQGTTSADLDDSNLGKRYASSTGVTVEYTVDEEGEAHTVGWSSTTPVERVWLKAGNDTDRGVSPATSPQTVQGNAFSHITFCYAVTATAACNGTVSEVTVTIPSTVTPSIDVHVDDTLVETITATDTFTGTAGQVLEAHQTGKDVVLATATFLDCGGGGGGQAPTVSANEACVGEASTITVTITNPDAVAYSVDVLVDGTLVDTITTTDSYTGADGAVLTVEETGEDTVLATATFTDCTSGGGDQAPTVSANEACVGEASTITVTITNPDAVAYSVDVLVDGTLVDTITTTDSYTGADGAVLTVEETGEDTVLATATFTDCTSGGDGGGGGDVPTTATLAIGTECAGADPGMTYEVEVEEGDDEFGTHTISVIDADGDVVTTIAVDGDDESLVPMAGLDGESLSATWTFDDTQRMTTLDDDCGTDVRGVVVERGDGSDDAVDGAPDTGDGDPAEPVVEGVTLPNAGFDVNGIAPMALLFLALGAGLLLADRRRTQTSR